MKLGLTSDIARTLQTLVLIAGLLLILVLPALAFPQHASAADCPDGQVWQPTYSAATGGADGGGTCVPAPSDSSASTSSDCDGVLWSLWSPFKCFLRYMIGAISAGLMYIASWLLVLAAKMFEGTLYYTVVQFNVIYDIFKDWIERGWQIFRDLANIGIIGIFVFIAISFILGIKEYGEKRLIANVLIVAVLINFSLLFTKIIINASNAVSSAVYAAQLTGGTPASDSSSITNLGGTTDNGIAGRFVRSMGLKTFSDSLDANVAIGKSGGIWAQFLYGVFFALLFVAAAIVFLYGSFLLIARAILLFLLMMTSAAAFATYMIPSLAHSEYGWSTWWSSLLRSAVLIPIMMVLLAISIGISESISKGGRGSLGDLVGHPDKPADVMMLLNYFFVLGFLFAAIKISSSLAGTISGLKLGNKLATTGAFGIPYLGGAMIGRQTLGRFAAMRSDALAKRIDTLKTKRDTASTALGRAYYGWRASANDNKKQRSDKLAKSEFNLGNTKLGAALATSVGAMSLATKGGGIAGREAEAAKKIAEKAGRLAPGDTQKAAIREEAVRNQREQKNILTQQKQAAEANKQAAEATKKAMEQSVETEKGIAAQMQSEHETAVKALHKEIGSIETAGGDSAAKRAELTQTRAQHADAMNAQKQRIETAKATVEGTQAWKDIQAKIAEHAAEMEKIDGDISKIETPEAAVKRVTEAAVAQTANMARLGFTNKRVKALVKKKFGEAGKLKERKERIEAEKAIDKDLGLDKKPEEKKADAH